MKQTAIDYLIKQMNMQCFFGVYCTEDKIDENRKLMTKIIEQAKAMHKEEMIDFAFSWSHERADRIYIEKDYNETYNQ